MIVYQTDPEGYFVGPVEADESPLEPGVYLIPRGCVGELPPGLADGERARWAGDAWEIVPPSEPEPEPEPPPLTLADYRRAVEAHVEETARARDYSSAVSCVSYMLPDPSDPTLSDEDRAWDAEARVFHRWRNAVWAQVFAALEAWQGGGEAPTIEGLIASLPAIEWPS